MEKSQQLWLDFTPQQSLKEAAAVFWCGDFAMGTRGSDPRSGGAIYADSAANQDQWNFMVMSGDKIDDTRITGELSRETIARDSCPRVSLAARWF